MYEYKVKYVEESTGKEFVEYGLIGGCTTYKDAMNQLAGYYGDTFIIKVSLYCIDEAYKPIVYKEGVKSLAENFREVY